MYFLLKKHSLIHIHTHTHSLSQHFVRGKSFVSMSKIHLCGRWQLVKKEPSTQVAVSDVQAAHAPLIDPFGQFFFPSLGSNAAKCKGHLAASLARIALAIVVVVAVHRHICELPVRHAPHTHAHTPTEAHVQHTLSMWARTMCSH